MMIKDKHTPELGICPIDCATMVVFDDEPCLGLFELDIQSPDYRGFHRYQVIKVIRDDKPTEAWIDMGLSSQYKHDQIRIPGGAKDDSGKFWIEHTVAELRSIADQIRDKPSFDTVELVCSKSGAQKIRHNGNSL